MKYDLSFTPPWINAPGSLGFSPARLSPMLEHLGAFVTNPISLEARSPAQARVCLSFPGGFLLHTGHPNPGLRQVTRRYAAAWQRSPVPVVLSLLPQSLADVVELVNRAQRLPGVSAMELGLPPRTQPEAALSMVRSAQADLPLILRLPLDQAVNWLAACPSEMTEHVAAISLGAPRGVLPDSNGKFTAGRLFGPAIFPQALAVMRDLAQTPFPIIAGGGVYTTQAGQALITAGALAVQLDAVLWRGGLPSTAA